MIVVEQLVLCLRRDTLEEIIDHLVLLDSLLLAVIMEVFVLVVVELLELLPVETLPVVELIVELLLALEHIVALIEIGLAQLLELPLVGRAAGVAAAPRRSRGCRRCSMR